jgi:DHA2 family multidrug resistance protein-like MFS transporter
MIEYFWWGSVFLIAIPIMRHCSRSAPLLLPEFRDPNAGRIDIPSALLSLAAVLGLVYGIKHWAAEGFDWLAAIAILIGSAFILIFIRRQRRLADPMVDLAMFRIPAFRAALTINLASILFMFGSFIFLAQYFQLVAGLTPLQAGLWSLPSAIAFTLASFVTPALVGRYKPATLMAGGMAVSALGFVWLVFAPSLIQIVSASVVFSIGFTPVITLTTGIVVGSAPPERTGAASAMSETSAELGGALGIAVLGSLGAALYRNRMADIAVPGFTADALVPAKSTLGGALALASGLSPDQAAPMLARASEAFMVGFRAAAVLSIVGMLFCIVVTLTTLRDAKRQRAHRRDRLDGQPASTLASPAGSTTPPRIVSSRWMPPAMNRLSKPINRAPARSVRTASPITSTLPGSTE